MKICLVNTAIMFSEPWINNRIKKDKVSLGVFLNNTSNIEAWDMEA